MKIFYEGFHGFLSSRSWSGVSAITGIISLMFVFIGYFTVTQSNRNVEISEEPIHNENSEPDNYIVATGIGYYKNNGDPNSKNHARREAEIQAQRKIAEKIEVMISSESKMVGGTLASDIVETRVDQHLKSIEVIETKEFNDNTIHVKIRVPKNEN